VRAACERVQCEYLMRTVRTRSVGPALSPGPKVSNFERIESDSQCVFHATSCT
jgi:hypothetical protein